MKKTKVEELETTINPALAKEETMLRRILDSAKSFYQKPENVQAYEAWLENQKEAIPCNK